ncbi:MAG TPA: polyprenyl synthetase family protein [Candidatus Elarobacter sp.]|jgi:geranylgeranyl diphosphate synthase type I|nr:polyprenyl synthetase family protein [Candidatus Elarobacter sp.]
MSSPATLDSLEAALERAVTRFDDASPVSAQIKYHFGFGDEARRGKRLRSRLVLEVAREEGLEADEALAPACAVEIIHEFSLIHDDIEDGDRLRRGRETLWARFGAPHGINSGDALCSIAYLTLLDDAAGPPARTLAMNRVLLAAHLAMCGGQGRDIAFETEPRVTMEDYREMIGGKTAALFSAACELGALAAGCDAARARAYARLGCAYGIAFQIEDDVLGTWGDTATTGKPAGADLAKRKWTFPVVWALSGPPSEARSEIASAYAHGAALSAGDVARTVDALDRLGARDAAQLAARTELAEADAVAEAAGVDRSGRVRAFFRRAARRSA